MQIPHPIGSAAPHGRRILWIVRIRPAHQVNFLSPSASVQMAINVHP